MRAKDRIKKVKGRLLESGEREMIIENYHKKAITLSPIPQSIISFVIDYENPKDNVEIEFTGQMTFESSAGWKWYYVDKVISLRINGLNFKT